MLIRGADLPGRGTGDLRIQGAHIAEIGPGLARVPGEPVLEARGGALLPGLHDHHAHLFALAAAGASLDCGPPAVRDAAGLARALVGAPGRGWLRGVGYHESVAGRLDRAQLDAWLPDRPLRIQHRGGALWMLNSAALAALGIADGGGPEGAGRDAAGRPDGRLFRADRWLREHLPGEAPDLAPVGALLAARGVTGVTDASAHNDADALARLTAACRADALPQRLLVMGLPGLPRPASPRVARGAVKALLDEPRLPDFADFCAQIRAAHAERRAFAVHCVTRSECLFALAGFAEAGARPGDRLEHASVAPPDTVALAATHGLRVVTQPHFVAERGDQYLAEVAADDLPWLYRLRGWLEAGVPLAAGSDAPYGAPDPWAAMRAASRRETAGGRALGPDEALSPEAALSLFLGAPDDPGGPPRRLEPGAEADLCLLDRPWREARGRLTAEDVAATWCAGQPVFRR